ncbi:hypothetical protein [Histophilus somni]|uniref:hypothetical protein n=1 Tax=Histophilus somni TaxID=731 RepID=UPI00201E7852|nr:hypothetical protein [Histophilus somni]
MGFNIIDEKGRIVGWSYARFETADGQQLIPDDVEFEEGKPVRWDGSQWVVDEERMAELFKQRQEELIAHIATKADSFKDVLLKGYPQTEIESFYRQEKEALDYQANPEAPAPMLRQIAEQRGLPFEILVQKVLEKSAHFAVLVGVIIGQRQKFEDRILGAENEEQLTEIENEVQTWQPLAS